MAFTDNRPARPWRSDLDYSALLERYDPDHAPISLARALKINAAPESLDHDQQVPPLCPDQAQILGIVVRHWMHCDIPTHALDTMTGVLVALLNTLQASTRPELWRASERALRTFATDNLDAKDADDIDTIHLRRNTINAALLSLQVLCIIDGDHPLLELPQLNRLKTRRRATDTTQGKTRLRYDRRGHVRAATHDEVLLARLASRLVQGKFSVNRCAAAVAFATSTAAVSEIPQVSWVERGRNSVILPGRRSGDGNSEKDIARRTVPLDQWSATALDDWHAESRTAFGYSHNHRMLYAGRQNADSESAHASVSGQISAALARAGLQGHPGIQPDSLRLWSAAKGAVDKRTALEAAELAGVGIATLHRLLHQTGERALRVA